MATTILRPDADISNGWTITDGGAIEGWEVLDDAVEQPTAPTTASDYVSTSTASTVARFRLSTVSVSSASNVTLWVYAKHAASADTGHNFFPSVQIDGTPLLDAPVWEDDIAQWYSGTLATTLTQTDVDGLEIKLDSGGVTNAHDHFVYAAYVELTFELPGPPVGSLAMLHVG